MLILDLSQMWFVPVAAGYIAVCLQITKENSRLTRWIFAMSEKRPGERSYQVSGEEDT